MHQRIVFILRYHDIMLDSGRIKFPQELDSVSLTTEKHSMVRDHLWIDFRNPIKNSVTV